jgi:hypothetical protein
MIPTTAFRPKWLLLMLFPVLAVMIIASITQQPSVESLDLSKRNVDWQGVGFSHRPFSESALAQLDINTLWGVTQFAANESTSNSAWLLRGVIDDKGTKVAIVELDIESTDSARFGRYVEGDILPDGSTLVLIAKQSVEYNLNGKVEVKQLYEAQ